MRDTLLGTTVVTAFIGGAVPCLPPAADLTLADDYNANQYGMMGTSRYGHSFILVGPDGEILWRADYGGAPDYTMYLPPDQLLDDIRAAAVRA